MKYFQNSRGVAMVELALVLPLLIMVIFGSFEIYNLLVKKTKVYSALIAAGRIAGTTSYSGATCLIPITSEGALEDELRKEGIDVDLQTTVEDPLDYPPRVLKLSVTLPYSCVLCLGGSSSTSSAVFRLERESICADRVLSFQ